MEVKRVVSWGYSKADVARMADGWSEEFKMRSDDGIPAPYAVAIGTDF
jgi:hypothetical protein